MLNFSSVLNRNASNMSTQTQPSKDDYMSLSKAYSKLNNMFKAYEAETDAAKKQQQGMDAINFRNTLNAAIADPNMPYYNPYTRATNYNIVDNLKKYYNIDLSDGITQSTINDLKKNVDYSKISYNYGGSIASNTKDSNQQLAYYISMLEDDEAITQKAEQELNSLQNDVWMLVKRGYSDNDIAKKIDMSKYPTLTKMDEGRQTNTPLTLNRRVNYSQDYLPAYIWAARNDYQLNSDEAYINALIGSNDGVGEHYIPKSSSYASLDPSSEYYAPYGQTTTLFDLGSKYKTTSFDRKWLDEHKSELLNGDSASQKEYTKILTAVENADAATEELKKLNAWRDQMVASGKSADEITALLTNSYDGEKSLLEEEYPTLAKMENKRTRGAALELGYAVDFSLPIFKENTRLAARKRDMNAALHNTESAKVATLPITRSEIEAVRAAAGENKEDFSAMDSVAADFSVAAFKQNYADKTEIEYNTAVSNLEDDIVAYKNGKAFKDLSEDAQRFIKTNPELFEGIRNWNTGDDLGTQVKYNAIEQTLKQTRWDTNFTSTGIGKTASDAILYADDAVRDGLLSPEDNAAFLIGVAEAREKAKNAGMSLEDYLNSDESVRKEVVGGMYEVVAANDEASTVQRKELQDSFVKIYMQSQQNEWNGTATDDEASFLEQVNNYNVDLSKDEYYLGVLNDNDEYARELMSDLTDGIEEILDARDYTPVQSYMVFSNDGSKLMAANIADAANAVYTADMRAARWAGFKNLTDFYEAYPELEVRAQERAKAAAGEKLAEYQEFNDTFSLLWKQSAEQGTIQGTNAGEYALQKGEEGLYLQDKEGTAYNLKDEDDVYDLRSDSSGDSSNGQIGLSDIRNYIQQSVRADYAENNKELQRDENGNLIETAAKEDQWNIFEAVPKVMWQGLKSGVVTVPLNFAQAMEYFFYYKSNEDLEAELRSTVSREDYRSKVEYDISDESGVIPDENRRKMLQTKLYGDAEQGIAPYSGDIYDFGYDVDKASLLKYIESRQEYLNSAREDVQKYAPYMLDAYDTEVSVVQNVINMGLMMAGSAIGGGSAIAQLVTSMLVYGLPEGAEMGRTLEEKFGLSHNTAAAWALAYGGLIAGMETVMFDKLEEGILSDDPDTLLGEKKVLARNFATKLVKDPGFAQSAAKYFAGNLCTATLSTPFEALQEGVEALAGNAVVSVATRNVELKPGETYTPESFLGVTIDAAPVSFWLGFISGTIGDTKSVLAAKNLAKQRSVSYKQALDVTEALKADVEKAKAEYQEKGAGYYSDLVQQEKYAVDNFAKSMAEINQGSEVQQAQQAQTAYEEQQSKVSDAQEAYDAAATQAQAQAEALAAEDIPSADTIAEMQRIQGEVDSAAEKLKNENSLLEKTKKAWQDKQAQVDEIKKAALKQAEVDAQMRVAQERAEADIAEKQRIADKAQAQTDALIDDMAKDIQAAVGREGEDTGAVKDKIKSNADKLGKYLQGKQAQMVEDFNKSVPGWTLKFDAINDRGTRGYVDKESKTIYLNSNMGTLDQIRATEGHELTHVLESLSDYSDVQNAIFDAYYQGNTERLADDLAAIKARYDLQADKTGNEGFRLNTEEAQRQELLGDLVGQLLFKSDPKIIDHIAAKNQGVVRRMLQWVSDKCKELWIRVSKKGGKEMAQAYREMTKIRDTFTDALNRATQVEEQGQNNAADVAAAQTEQAQQQATEAPVAENVAENVAETQQQTQETPVTETVEETPAERTETPAESPEAAPAQTVEETVTVDSAPNESVTVDYTPVDASSLESIQQRMQDIQRAEAEEKQITLTNVTADTAAAIDKLREANGISYFRAFTNDPALRSQYSWLDYQVQAKSVSQYLDALRNPDVDNVVMTGEDASTMPRFAYQDGEWSTDYRGATNKQKQLARMIKGQGLEAEYIAKSPVERTTANSDYVANRDAGSRAMWEAKAGEENAGKNVQYSVGKNEESVLDKKEFKSFYDAIGEMKIGKTDQFPIDSKGQYMLAIGNKIVYTNGDWMNPSIEKVDVINREKEVDIEPIRDAIFSVEQDGGLTDEQKGRILAEVLQEEDFHRYANGIRRSNSGEIGRREGTSGSEVYRGVGRDANPQYSVQFDAAERLNILREFAKDINSQELYKYTIGERLNSIFRGTNLQPSFDQLNPVRIVQNLAAELGTSTYTADLSAMGDDITNVLSYYDTRARSLVVDKNSAADLGVTLYGLGQFVYDKCAAKLDTDTYSRVNFGQQFADYMTHENADCNPDFITDLTLALDTKTKQAVDAARNQVIRYSLQTDLQKAMNMIRDRAEERAGKKTLTGQLRQFYINNINAAYAASMIDYLTGTQELSLEASYLPHAKYMSESIIARDYVLPDGTRVGVAFNQMLQSLDVTWENEKIIGAYMLAEHDIYSMQSEHPRPVYGNTEQQNRNIMAQAKAQIPEIESIVKGIRSWWDTFMTDWYLDQGFTTQEEFARWHAENPYYVPAFDFEAEETDGKVKQRKGSTKEKINPFDAYVEYIQKIVNRVVQNNVAKTFHNLYQTNSGLGVIARQIPSSKSDIRYLHADVAIDSVPDAVLGDVRARLEEKGAAERRENGMNIFANANKQTGLEKNTLWVYLEDGTKVKYEIKDVPLYNLLKGSGDNTYRKVGRILSSVTNTMARLTTGLNPLFAGKNAIRDISKSINYGSWSSNYGSGLVKWFQNFGYTFSNYMKENFGGEVATDYADYRAMGGGESERFDTHKSTRNLKNALYGDTTLDKIWKAVTFPVIGINNIVEMNSRLVEYRYGKHNLNTAEGRKKAFMAAMEVTTDFQRGGQGGVFQFISKATPFFNATVQGLDQQVRMFGRGERERLGVRLAKTVTNNLISGALQVAMIGMFGTDKDKELYGLALDNMKNDFLLIPTHWFVKNPERSFLRIPLAQDALSKAAFAFGRKLIAGELPEEYQDDFAFDLKESIMDILSNQLPDSTIFSPILDVLTNRTWNDTQMTSDRNLQKSEVNQTNESMPQIFNDISALLSANNIHGKFTSPIALRYLFSQYTGVIGQVLLPMLSRDANGDTNLLRGLYTAVRNSFTLDPTYTNWVNGAYDDLYDKLETTIKDKGMIGGQLKAGMSEQEATEAYEAARALIGSKGTVTQINNEISALYDEINEITRSNADDAPQLSRDKRMEIVRLKKRAVELMQDWSDKYCADTKYLITLKTQPTVNAYTRAQSVAANYGVDAFGEIPDYLSYGANYAESIGKNTEAYSPHPTYSRTSKGVTKAVPVDKQSKFDAIYLKAYEDAFNGKGGADYFNSITNEETLQKELKDLHTKAQKAAEQEVPMVEVTE